MTATTSASGIAWDLSDLYSSPDDPRITADMDQADAEAEAFATTYRNTINVAGGPDPEHMRGALERLEALHDNASRVAVYAALIFAADTSQPAHRNLQQMVEQRFAALRNAVQFFDLEWLAMPDDDAQRLIEHPTLAPYRHYLQAERRYRPHTLSEPEERIVNEKDLSGVRSWQRYFTELLGSLSFPLEKDGEPQQLTLDAVLTLMRRPDRTLRQRAFEALYGVLGTQSQSLAYIYNTLLLDQGTMNRLRNYDNPMMARHLSNRIEPEAVETMMGVVEQNYDVAHRYFSLKARLLGLPQLEIYDQYAPIGGEPPHVTYAEGRGIVLEALGSFDSRFRDIADQFFEQSWIDAELRPAKRGGAFCSGHPLSGHPFILCNYTDMMNDVMTLAHELGHGIHFWLSRKQTLFNYDAPLPLAETASVFSEMLVFEHLLNREQDPQARLALVCSKIEDIFATVFRQNVLTRFEQAAYQGRAQGRMTPEQLNEHWHAANAPYYGEAVAQTAGYERGWSYIPHFIHTPFYCYSYVFGELLVLALYGMYREQGSAFVPRYMALLEAGGSRAPAELLAELGVDTHDPAFWQRGLDELRRLVEWAHELAA
jgi:oligoendopeptidase F